MSRIGWDQGVALASVLFCLAGLVVMTATLFLTTMIDLQATTNTAAASDAFYVAEAGIQHLWSILEPAPDFSEALSWPEGRPPLAAPIWLPRPVQTYTLRVTGASDGSLVALSEGTSDRGTRARVKVVFRREAVFRPVAALVSASSVTSAVVTGALDAVGEDRDRAERPLPAAGAENRAGADILQSALGNGRRAVVVGPSGLEAAANRLRPSPDRALTGPHTAGMWGQPDSPEVVRLVANAEIGGEVTAAGIVLADALLHVTGRFEVEGLLLAARGLSVDGSLLVHGGLWVAEGLTVSSSGQLRIDYASTPLNRANGLRPGALPRAPVLGAWEEVW